MKNIIFKINFFCFFCIHLSVNSQLAWDQISAAFKNDLSVIQNNSTITTGWQSLGPSTNDIFDFAFDRSDPI
jgi:hypothetical protein